jgi:protein-tyrosine phosphatase
MDKVYWVIDDRLGGRRGPNQEPWSLAAIKAGGVTMVVSLTERMFNRSVDFASVEIKHVCLPLSSNAPPLPGDEFNIASLLPGLVGILRKELAGNGKVVVHCSSGKDRSALLLAYYLKTTNQISTGTALDIVRSKNPEMLSAHGWLDMAIRILDHSPLSHCP